LAHSEDSRESSCDAAAFGFATGDEGLAAFVTVPRGVRGSERRATWSFFFMEVSVKVAVVLSKRGVSKQVDRGGNQRTPKKKSLE